MANCEYMGGMLIIMEKTFDLGYTVDLYLTTSLPIQPAPTSATAVFSTGDALLFSIIEKSEIAPSLLDS